MQQTAELWYAPRHSLLFLALYGIATMIRGHLIMRSRYFPGVFGVLFIIGGAGFFLRTTTLLLAPSYSRYFLLFPWRWRGSHSWFGF